jgi:hypothetical protein
LLLEDSSLVYSIAGLKCCTCRRSFKDKYLLFFHVLLEHHPEDMPIQNTSLLDEDCRKQIRQLVEEEQVSRNKHSKSHRHLNK